MKYDVAIIGGGPAGLSAAINLKILNKSVIVFSAEHGSSKLAKAPTVLNYLGVDAVKGKSLNQAFVNHAVNLGVEIVSSKVNAVYDTGANGFSIDLGERMEEAFCVILCTGLPSTATLKNEEKFLGRGVSYCATCDAPLYKGKKACVVGYDQDSIFEANYVSEICKEVVFVPMAKFSSELNEKIQVLKVLPVGFEGESKAQKLICDNGEIKADVFFVLKTLAADRLCAGLKMSEGSVVVDKKMATNIQGLFAAGDITGKPYKYQKSAGEGQIAAFSVAEFLDKNHR